ncbi:hypothetical protein HN018_23660 (plasmid) [Lichenicola cladoniae]|uniref:Uncharacterized protein n=1 Tax=Lichenicola cladoniae TaxID=1484109 RepID=A0A6M8HXA7_9PROT|nr:XF1762 family protein [Lichenicola cladoniae]NPD66282.1 hypothetical protein [Acetobacteraceae bacterium]QKE93184.1 hypothetical protein HN018_23660 [Lichenicola cladoniae]
MTDDSSTCLLCGEPEELSIHDIWTDGNFQLVTCCTGLLEQIASEIDADPAWGRALLRHLGAEELTGHSLRRVSDGQGNAPVLDFKLRLTPISFPAARAFIARHHRHCGPPHAWRFGSGVMNGSSLMGVVTVGNPVAPAFNGRGIVEVNRLCIRGDLDPMLRWNVAPSCTRTLPPKPSAAVSSASSPTSVLMKQALACVQVDGSATVPPAGEAGIAGAVPGRTGMRGSPRNDGHAPCGQSPRLVPG